MFERRKAKAPRTITPERPAQVVTILTWTPITRRRLVEQVEVLGMEEAPAARLIMLPMRYHRRFHRVKGRVGSCNLPLHPLHLSQHLSHLRRSKRIESAPRLLIIFFFFGFVTGSILRFHLICSLLLGSLGSYPPSMWVKRSIWTNMGTLIGSQCGRRS